MMGRGADGSRVGGENPCPIRNTKNCPKISRGEASSVINLGVPEEIGRSRDSDSMGMNAFTQALKALALRHPFDAEDGAGGGSDAAGASQYSGGGGDGRRKHRRLQGGRAHEGPSTPKIGATSKTREGKPSNFWDEFEEYFRSVTFEDVEALLPRTQIKDFDSTGISDSCLLLPRITGTQEAGANSAQRMNYATIESVIKKGAGQVGNELAFVQAIDGRGKERCTSVRAVVELAESPSNKQEINSEMRSGMGEEGSLSVLTAPEGKCGGNLMETASLANPAESASCKQEEISELGSVKEKPVSVLTKPEAKSGASLAETASLAEFAVAGSSLIREINQAETAITELLSSSCTGPIVVGGLEQEQLSGVKLHEARESNSVVNLSSPSNRQKCCGTKRKIFNASFYGNKRRKLLESATEVITTVVSPPENGEEELCHVCYGHDSEECNEILFCDTCNVSVHPQCYGVKNIPAGRWLCCWCAYQSQSRSRHKNSMKPGNESVSHNWSTGDVDNEPRPCILCPISGGALKPVARSVSDRHKENDECVQFAHLFCCQWVPETCIEHAETMEPIKNVEGIRDSRWKLLCSLCKVKHGACILCSHGNCPTAFHPLCARQMKLRMGISGKEGTDDVDLWAFCSKHSLPHVDRASLSRNGSVGGPSEAENLPLRENNQCRCSDGIEDDGGMDDYCLQQNTFHVKDLRTDLQNMKDRAQNKYLEKNDDAESADEDRRMQPKNNANLLSEDCNEQRLQDVFVKGKDLQVQNAYLKFKGNQVDDPPTDSDIKFVEKSVEYHLHPYIQSKLELLQHGSDAATDWRIYSDDQLESRALAEKVCFHGTQNADQETQCTPSNISTIARESQLEQLLDARTKWVLNLAPEDEIESEIVYLQSRLLDYGRINQRCSEDLVLRVIKNLSKEQEELQKQKRNKILVNEYLSLAKEAKKQGRKERRHKEAQATLAAATAAAAASSRIGSSRKDGSGDAVEEHGVGQARFFGRPFQADECSTRPVFSGIFPLAQPMRLSNQKHLKANMGVGRPPGSSLQTMLRPKETHSRPIVANISLEKQFDAFHLPEDSLQDESVITCDICRLQGSTHANKIYSCSYCRVAVHEDCYGISKFHSGGWYCDPCDEFCRQYQGTRLTSVASRGRPGYDVNCALCGSLNGAFKRTIDGQWVHVFCAEWILENTFRRGQTESIVGMELLSRERYASICSVCHQQGVCLKCNFGHCHATFHPSCARDSGFYMNVNTHNGNLQHKAYCEKHSSDQKLKAESQRCGGLEELKLMKEMRVMLERIRLICERTVRREKLKREIVHITNNVLASKRDYIAYSAVFHGSFLPLGFSSQADITHGSIVNSLRGRADESKVWKHSTKERHRMDGKALECTSLGQPRDVYTGHSDGKHTITCSADFGAFDDRNDAHRRPRKSRKHAETLQREVVMTPKEANMQNQRLPKGYAYVPARDLAEGRSGPPDFRQEDS